MQLKIHSGLVGLSDTWSLQCPKKKYVYNEKQNSIKFKIAFRSLHLTKKIRKKSITIEVNLCVKKHLKKNMSMVIVEKKLPKNYRLLVILILNN